MKTVTKKKESRFYKDLLTHCDKTYNNILFIRKAYLIENKVFSIDYVSIGGLESLATNTAKAESIIIFI
jgi:thiamine kinase-like enzyme